MSAMSSSVTDGAAASKPGQNPVLVYNGSQGLKICQGAQPFKLLQDLSSKSVRCFDMSPDGKTLVWSEAGKLIGYDLDTLKTVWDLQAKESFHSLKMSPKSSLVAAYYPYKSPPPGQEEEPNLFIVDLKSGQEKARMVCKKMTRWDPDWTDDETVCCRLNNTELQFFEKNCFERWTHHMTAHKTANFSLSTNSRNSAKYIACYSTGTKGQPSFVRIYRYPNLDNAISNKSFFNADSVSFMWSPRGDCLLFLCQADVDKSGKSYYGEQKLNYMEPSPSSSNNYIVTLKKEGPIHAVAWIPVSGKDQPQNYCVVYGFIPPVVSIFDTKGSIIFDFNGKEMKVNQICLNSWGTVLTLAGFGNLRGGICVWDLKTKKQVAEFNCPETTDISWNPDGLTMLTATTAPRLRVSNGYKIWKYNGTLVHEVAFPSGTELYKILWRNGVYSAPKITNNFKPTQVAAAAPAKYVPPSMREKQEYINSLKESERKAKGLQPAAAAVKAEKPKLTPQEKQLAALTRKLEDISKIKRKQSEGTDLKKNELDKLKEEDKLRLEMSQLKLSISN